MRVIIREAAYDDLDRIHSWIAKDRPQAADSVIDRILESAERLGQLPYLGHAPEPFALSAWTEK
jgi:plasmid stabilization system protein ParE